MATFTMPPLPDFSNMKTFLALVSNQKATTEFFAKWEALSDEIALQLKLVGTIEEVDTLKHQAETDRENARGLLADAHDESARIRAEAKRAVQATLDQVTEQQRLLDLRQTEIKAAQRLADDGLMSREAVVTTREQRATEAQAILMDRLAKVDRTAQNYRDKLAQLKDLAAVLG